MLKSLPRGSVILLALTGSSVSGAAPMTDGASTKKHVSSPTREEGQGSGSPRERGVPDVPDTLAQRGPGDGVYGRFEGDLSLSLGAGASWDHMSGEARPGLLLASRIYQTLGLYASFWQSVGQSPQIVRLTEVGLLIEPLFLLRWSADREWGHAFWDLAFDSLSLSLGAAITEPSRGNWGDESGFSAGLGWGLPLFGQADGPWRRFRGGVQTGSFEPRATALIYLEWQWFFQVKILGN